MVARRKPSPASCAPLRRAGSAGLLPAAILSVAAGTAQAASPLAIRVAGEESLLFDHARQACEPWDIPDTPSRAFRDAEGRVHLFQTHHRNRASVGPDLRHLAHDCAVAFRGRDADDPAALDNLSWIASTHTSDGRTIHAIVHNEFHGDAKGTCEAGTRMRCWYNTLTAAVSRDGGRTFHPVAPRRLVAALPFRAKETEGRHAGYFEPTNIVAHEGALFMMANVVSPAPQRNGNCLLRTQDIADPGAWRGFRNGGFEVRFADPYGEPRPEPDTQLCEPIAPSSLPWPVTSLARFEPAGRFIALMKGRRTDEGGTERTGVFYSTSPDLLAWEGPTLLYEASIDGCAPAQPINYPALIDPESRDRNFGSVGPAPLLTFVRTRPEGCDLGPARDVVARRVEIGQRGN